MRVGVIGLGNMGSNHARVLKELGALGAICDVDRARRVRAASTFGVVGYRTPEDLLKDRSIDSVVVSTPTTTHHRLASLAFEAGRHVLVEKPIARTPEEGEALVALARKSGKILGVGHIESYNPIMDHLTSAVRRDLFGALLGVWSRRVGPWPPQIRDVGVTLDLATHEIDNHLRIFRRTPSQVFAQADRTTTERGGVEHSIHILLRFGPNITSSIQANWISPARIREIEVWTKRAVLRADYLQQTVTKLSTTIEPIRPRPGEPVTSHLNEAKVYLPKVEPLKVELQDFVEACTAGREMKSSGKTGLRTLRVAIAALASAAGRRIVSL